MKNNNALTVNGKRDALDKVPYSKASIISKPPTNGATPWLSSTAANSDLQDCTQGIF
jgi:hypothetical protein